MYKNLPRISPYLTVELLAPPSLVPELHLPSVVPVFGGGGLLIVVALAPLATDDAAQGFLGGFFLSASFSSITPKMVC